MDGRDDRLPFGRRRRTAASALVAILVAFVLGVLFNAPAMKKTATELPFGGARSFRLALVSPASAVSHWLYLDRPARFAAAVLGRPDPGPRPGEGVAVAPRPTPSTGQGGKPGRHPADRPLPKPYAGHPMHLLIAGDSMAGIPGMALVNLSRDTRLIKPLLDYRISSGLVRPDFFDWPAQLRRHMKAFDPGAVVVMWGANDNQGVQTSSGKVYQFGSSGWKKEYRRRVDEVVALLFDGGVRRVYWVGQPVMPGASYDRQVRLVNDIYRAAAERHRGVRYIDAYSLLSDDSGYSQYLRDGDGRLQQVREGDGEHLTYAGGMRVAEAIMAAIRAEWLTKDKKDGGSAPPSPSASAQGKPAASASKKASPTP